ncbi:MAG: SGNH/GDSL hydrolase family protein [Jiangellaceae bacterium]
MPAGRAIVTILLTVAAASLLCADSLVQVAERQPFGRWRDTALTITRSVRGVSHAFGLHLPRLWLGELTGNEDLPSSSPAGSDVAVPSATVPTTDAAKVVDKPSDSALPTTLPTTLPPATTTTLPSRRVPSAEDPLRVLMAGDSLMGNIAAGLGRLTSGDARIAITADFHVSTGLARPDVLDWPAYLNQRVAELNPEVVYLTFGGNDDQDMIRADGVRVQLGSPEWRDEYARRVALATDVAAQGGRTVVWLGLPAERPERLNAAKDVMNAVAREQADLRPTVQFVDLMPIFSPDGAFSETVGTPDGQVVDTRAPDGVHLSHPGADLLAPALFAAVATEWHLVEPPAPPPPPPAPPPTAPPPPPPPPPPTSGP